MKPTVKAFFDPPTSTLTYVVNTNSDAVVIDSVLNYDQASSTVSLESVNKASEYIKSQKFSLHAILETHVHADHLSGAQNLKKIFPESQIAIGFHATQIQKTFKSIYNFSDLPCDGSQFDLLLRDNQNLIFGDLSLRALSSPGHTPSDMCYLIGDALFTGDTLFMPDSGTGRCDFPDGSAKEMYNSITQKIYSLPPDTRVFVGHDYQPGGRETLFESSVGEHCQANIHLNSKTSQQEFISFRTQRDQKLNAPQLLLPSIQFNIRGGHFDEPEANGVSYLKIPIQNG